LLEQLACEPPVGWADLAVAVFRHPLVQADRGVQVHQAAALVLGHLHVGDLDQFAQALLRDAGELGELAWQVDRGVAPQLAEQVVPDHCSLVVKAVQAQRLPEARIIRAVDAAAGEHDAVAADRAVAARMAAQRRAVRAEDVGVYDPEAWRGQRREDRRMASYRVGHAFAAPEAGGDELPGVAAVALRARPADRLAPVPARLSEQPVRFAVGRPDLLAAAVAVADVDPALEADGP
jgi:hypothetical protein